MPDIAEPEIAYALYRELASRGTQIMVPRVHLLVGEQDFVAVTAAGYAHEYEIKVSRADFRADMRKKEHGYWRDAELKHDLLSGKVVSKSWQKTRLPREFSFVLPKSLGIGPDDVPDHAGLIHCERQEPTKYNYHADILLTFPKPAPALRHAEKLDEWARTKIMRALTDRFWYTRVPKVVDGKRLYADEYRKVRQ